MERRWYLYLKRIIRQAGVEESPVGKMSVVCWRRNKKKNAIIQTLYLDYWHYVPITHKRTV